MSEQTTSHLPNLILISTSRGAVWSLSSAVVQAEVHCSNCSHARGLRGGREALVGQHAVYSLRNLAQRSETIWTIESARVSLRQLHILLLLVVCLIAGIQG